jgi:ElaB/YqjD/DUF883 family membrane-anchored ribosome-binding protein
MENNHLTSQTRETLTKDVNNLKRDARQIADDVKKHAVAHVDETKQRINDTIDFVRNYATTHPFALLGFGVVFGFILGRRRRA